MNKYKNNKSDEIKLFTKLECKIELMKMKHRRQLFIGQISCMKNKVAVVNK